ncbi:smalltalk protein [Bacteroides fragilis]|nr:smalltalk protein [Bacteroides fragilis]MCS2881815.1 smalltalk protein [Bacteroides fragilis]
MKKSNWNTILKVMIAVASAILEVLGGNAMNL